MVSIQLCSSFPTEKCFKAGLEQKLLVTDKQADFQSQMTVELGTPLSLQYSLIYNGPWQTQPRCTFLLVICGLQVMTYMKYGNTIMLVIRVKSLLNAAIFRKIA